MVTPRAYAIPWLQELKAKGYHVYYLSNFSHKAETECAEALNFLPEMLSDEGKVYLAEQAAIQSLAQNGSAVFMGHCASEALKDRKGVVKVFIHADDAFKQKRIQEDYQISPNRMEFLRKKYDKKRANYYRANTMKRWDDYRNYDIVLNSGELGIEGCVKVLKGLLA